MILSRLLTQTAVCLAVASTLIAQVRPPSPNITIINFPGSVLTEAWAINNNGQIVGFYQPASGYDQGFLYEIATARFFSFSVPGPTTYTAAFGINDSGLIVGGFERNGDGIDHGFRRTADGRYHQVVDPGQPFPQDVADINNFGDLVGDYSGFGYLYSSGTFTTIMYPGSIVTVASKLNDSLAVVGWWFDSSGIYRGMLLQNGVYSEVTIPGAIFVNVYGINNAGDMVGLYEDSASQFHGFLVKQGVVETIDCPGSMEFTSVIGVNDADTYVGYCGPKFGPAQAFFGTP